MDRPNFFEVETHITQRLLVAVRPYQGADDAGVFANEMFIGDKDGTVGSIRKVEPQYVDAVCARVDGYIDATGAADPVDAQAPRFPETSCSQCGEDIGPGDAGVSSCSDHDPTPVRHVRICGEGV